MTAIAGTEAAPPRAYLELDVHETALLLALLGPLSDSVCSLDPKTAQIAVEHLGQQGITQLNRKLIVQLRVLVPGMPDRG